MFLAFSRQPTARVSAFAPFLCWAEGLDSESDCSRYLFESSNWGYTGAMVGFAIITVYMTVAAFFLAFKGIAEVEQDHKLPSEIFSSSIFRNIVLSLVATLGLYLLSSILFVSAWLTSVKSKRVLIVRCSLSRGI